MAPQAEQGLDHESIVQRTEAFILLCEEHLKVFQHMSFNLIQTTHLNPAICHLHFIKKPKAFRPCTQDFREVIQTEKHRGHTGQPGVNPGQRLKIPVMFCHETDVETTAMYFR